MKRYSLLPSESYEFRMHEDAGGEWVKYEDVAPKIATTPCNCSCGVNLSSANKNEETQK